MRNRDHQASAKSGCWRGLTQNVVTHSARFIRGGFVGMCWSGRMKANRAMAPMASTDGITRSSNGCVANS